MIIDYDYLASEFAKCYKDKSRVIFPKQMSIVFPLRDGSQFKLYKYATYYNEDNVHFIKNNTDLGNYNSFFLYNVKMFSSFQRRHL